MSKFPSSLFNFPVCILHHLFKHYHKNAPVLKHSCNNKQRRGEKWGIPWGCLLGGLSLGQKSITLDLKADQRTVEVGFCILVPRSPQTTVTKQVNSPVASIPQFLTEMSGRSTISINQHGHFFLPPPQDQERASG